MCMWIYLPVVTILLSICMLEEHGVHFNQTNCTTRNASGSSLDWRVIMSNKKHFLKKTDRIENLNIYAKEQAVMCFLCHIFKKIFKFYKFIISVTINFEGFFDNLILPVLQDGASSLQFFLSRATNQLTHLYLLGAYVHLKCL